MSATPFEAPGSGAVAGLAPDGCTPRRRVRHEARDAVAVMVFSATASCGVAALLTLVVRLGG